MKNMIERYIYAVVRRLPEETREEVKSELQANIYDMLPENPTDQEIENLLVELGNPRDMAVKYQTKERYLISPRYFDDYIYTLKIVIAILVIVSVVFGFIDELTTQQSRSAWEMIGRMIGDAIANSFEGAYQGFLFTTIIFVIIEQAQLKIKKPWTIKDLPELPKENKVSISRTSTIVSLVFSMTFSLIFIMILADYHDVVGLYIENQMVAPFFNTDYIKVFVPIFVILLGLSLLVHVFKLMDGRWTWRVTILYTITQLAEMIVLIVFFTSPDMMDSLFHIEMANLLEIDVDKVRNGFEIGFRVIASIIGFFTAVDLGVTWYKVLRYEKKQTKSVKA